MVGDEPALFVYLYKTLLPAQRSRIDKPGSLDHHIPVDRFTKLPANFTGVNSPGHPQGSDQVIMKPFMAAQLLMIVIPESPIQSFQVFFKRRDIPLTGSLIK